MRYSQRGQSIIEFTVVITLVALAIIIMGPYVIRSINGHLKAWEDGVDDWINDPFLPGNVDDVPPPPCSCSPLLNRGCNLSGCPVTEMYSERDCSPLGCDDPQAQCTSSAACCTPWVVVTPGFSGCGLGCPYGERLMSHSCGGGKGTQIVCVADPGCVFQCQGSLPDNSSACPDANKEVPSPGIIWVPVATGGCNLGTKCEAECDVGMVLNSVLQTCDPPPPPVPPECHARRDPPVGFNTNQNADAACLFNEFVTGGGIQDTRQASHAYPSPQGSRLEPANGSSTLGLDFHCWGESDPQVACYAMCCDLPGLSCIARREPATGWASNNARKYCDPGEVVVGGGGRVGGGYMNGDFPVKNGAGDPAGDGDVPTGWYCYGPGEDTACWVICCVPPTPNFKCVARKKSSSGSGTALCNPGELLTGGGGWASGGASKSINEDYPSDASGNPAIDGSVAVGWHCRGDPNACWAICCTPP